MSDLIDRQAVLDWLNDEWDGMVLSVFDGIRALPSAQPTEASCWGCNCPKMERLKEQKTFSEMVHLHDAETHEERTETHGVCLDTISRQMAIDAFKKELTVGESKGNYVTLCSAVSYEGAKQILESLPSAQPEWIPCSERLPEDYTDVLAWFEYFRYGNYNCLYQTYGIGSYSMEYDSWMINHETGWHKLRVIAWMPLPDPWKGEDNGQNT